MLGVILKLMIGVIFLFIDCHKFENVLRKLEYSDIYLAEMVRVMRTTSLLWQGYAGVGLGRWAPAAHRHHVI